MRLAISILAFLALASMSAAENLPPIPPSPIVEFRAWLTNAAERKVALARRSEKSRRVLEQKIEEYNVLPETERNRRLEAVEERWYLRTLMEIAPARRSLETVPVLFRPLIEVSLEKWDKMRPDLQKEVLENEMLVQHFVALSRKELTPPPAIPEEKRKRLEEFFNLKADQQERTLDNFSARERQEMANTLLAFRALSNDQRDLCIRSFAKFANMPRAEQLAFLRNAERWQAMPPKDRAMWREVVKVVPPMPSIGGGVRPPMPN